MMANNSIDLSKLKKAIFTRFFMFFVVMGLMFFLPAGTFWYWEAWVYMAILVIPMIFVAAYFLKHDPGLIERRMRTKEKEAKQKTIKKLSALYFFAVFLIPGFDHRYEWSSISPTVIILTDIVVLSGYIIFIRVLKENSYASRIIEVEQNQKVITTGPYAIVRHPMYTGVLLMYGLSPLALGSYWAMIPCVLLPFLIVARIKNEEKVLIKELEGYDNYVQKVKYRLIPKVW